MNLDALSRFIVTAKAQTYAAGGAKAPSCRPGSHDLVFTDGDWSYRDSYFGGTDFLGQEAVWWQGRPVWAMNYYGQIVDDTALDGEVAGRVVTAALSALYREGRFLGGFGYQVDGWDYEDTSTGTVAHFEGREVIRRPGGEPAYRLVYHGGLIRD